MDQIFDVICMLCGRSLGQIHQQKLYRDTNEHSLQRVGKRTLCGYCGGSLYLQPDDSGTLRFRTPAAANQHLRAS